MRGGVVASRSRIKPVLRRRCNPRAAFLSQLPRLGVFTLTQLASASWLKVQTDNREIQERREDYTQMYLLPPAIESTGDFKLRRWTNHWHEVKGSAQKTSYQTKIVKMFRRMHSWGIASENLTRRPPPFLLLLFGRRRLITVVFWCDVVVLFLVVVVALWSMYQIVGR